MYGWVLISSLVVNLFSSFFLIFSKYFFLCINSRASRADSSCCCEPIGRICCLLSGEIWVQWQWFQYPGMWIFVKLCCVPSLIAFGLFLLFFYVNKKWNHITKKEYPYPIIFLGWYCNDLIVLCEVGIWLPAYPFCFLRKLSCSCSRA